LAIDKWKLERNFVEPNDRFDFFEKEITRQPDERYCTPITLAIDKWRLERNFQVSSGRLKIAEQAEEISR
jgi:hypothetical protein